MTMERTCKPVAAETINKLTFKDKMRAPGAQPLDGEPHNRDTVTGRDRPAPSLGRKEGRWQL